MRGFKVLATFYGVIGTGRNVGRNLDPKGEKVRAKNWWEKLVYLSQVVTLFRRRWGGAELAVLIGYIACSHEGLQTS